MILIDTGPLVGLINPRDAFYAKSRADLQTISAHPLIVTVPVLTETFHLLRVERARLKLRELLSKFNVAIQDISQSTITATLDWMHDYADHQPDFADAVTVVLSFEIKSASVWTYDKEFLDIWRRPDGSAIPMAIRD